MTKPPPDRILRGDHCQCGACGEYFNSTHAFDKHRRGEYRNRRCLTTDEMVAAKMSKNADGWWISSALQVAPAYLHGNSRDGDLPEPMPEALCS